jgi:hypothetical protein
VERTGNKLEQPDSHIVTGQAGKYLVQDDRQRPESQLRPQTELPERIDLVRDAPAGIAESDPDTRLKQVESGRSRGAIESDPLNQRGVLEVRPRAPKNIVEPGSEVARPERDGFLLHETNSSQKPRQEPELQVPRIQVTIGRVEVRAVYSPQPRPAVSRPAPSMTLDDYLKQREAGS